MTHTKCSHCGVKIVDHSTMVERQGQAFCCPNCAEVVNAPPRHDPKWRRALPHANCSRCGVQIVNHGTMVERQGMLYCCPNCARAEGADEEAP